ncbi:unnamed protein product, partial [Cladocopium goreaui]
MALMDHLKSLDSERQKAQRYARELHLDLVRWHKEFEEGHSFTGHSHYGLFGAQHRCRLIDGCAKATPEQHRHFAR